MKNLVRLRKQENLTQQELADALEINKQQLSEFERGRRTPNFEVLDKIAAFFQATPNQIFGSSQEIELERAVYQSDEYSEKTQDILTSIKQIEGFYNDEGYREFLSKMMYLVSPQPLYDDVTGEALYWKVVNGIVDKSVTYPFGYFQQQSDSSEAVQATKESPLKQFENAHKDF